MLDKQQRLRRRRRWRWLQLQSLKRTQTETTFDIGKEYRQHDEDEGCWCWRSLMLPLPSGMLALPSGMLPLPSGMLPLPSGRRPPPLSRWNCERSQMESVSTKPARCGKQSNCDLLDQHAHPTTQWDTFSSLENAEQIRRKRRKTSATESFSPMFGSFPPCSSSSPASHHAQCDQLSSHQVLYAHKSTGFKSCQARLRFVAPVSSPFTMSIVLSAIVLSLLAILPCTHGDANRFYHMTSLCQRGIQPYSKKIDGAVLSSKAENNLDCTITFRTDTISQKFMIQFEKLALDCNDHLYIYDGAHTIGNHKADFSCRSTRAEIGTIYTQSSFLTLRYTTDAYSKMDNGFRMIITSYKDSKSQCHEHRCANQFCISRDLICDRINHCGDNSDETYTANCQEAEPDETIIGLEPLYFIAVVSAVFTFCLVCVISVSVCLCRRERLLQQQRLIMQQQYGMAQMVEGITGVPHGLAGPNLVIGPPGTTPILGLNNYGGKLDGTCTMITSLDGYGATRNGGLVNSFTHTALPNNFATLPHMHHNPGAMGLSQAEQAQQAANLITLTSSPQMPAGSGHVRFGTLPARGGDKPAPPPYATNGNAIAGNATANGAYSRAMAEMVVNSSGMPGMPIQTQVIYTSK